MAKDTAMIKTKNQGLIFTLSFFTVMIVNAVVIAAAHQLFPRQIVIGTMSMTPFQAVLMSSAALSLITILVLPLFTEIEIRNKRALSPVEMIIGYFFIDFIGLWVITRVAELFGLGVTSWFVVLALAIVLDFLQGAAMMALEQWRVKQLS